MGIIIYPRVIVYKLLSFLPHPHPHPISSPRLSTLDPQLQAGRKRVLAPPPLSPPSTTTMMVSIYLVLRDLSIYIPGDLSIYTIHI